MSQGYLIMQTVDTLLHARWVVPIVPRGIVHEYYSIAINHGKIIDILSTPAAKKHYLAGDDIELGEHVLLPGLVNAHTHSPMVLFRGLADDMALMEWLQQHIWPAEQALVNDEFMRDGMRLAMAEMLSSGTTCFNEHYFFSDVSAEVIAEVGMRARVGLMIISVATAYAKNVEEYLAKGEAILARGSANSLINFGLAPHGPYTLDDAILLKIKALSDKLNLPIHMHVHETSDEIMLSLRDHGKRPLARLHNLGLLSPLMQNVHLTQVNDEEIALLKNTGCHVIHCPESNLKLASGYCPVQKLLDAGINLALGTDGAASNNDLDLFGEMHTAALLGKTVANDPTATSATNILEMATLGGAKALGLAADIGSLEAGKAADLIAVNLNHLNTQPVYNPISQLVYACHSSQVTDVWVAGKQLLKKGHLQTIDSAECIAAAQKWRARILKNSHNL
jgi:5-methylthioadenosine/S-adenosylhomocysteine deaminase